MRHCLLPAYRSSSTSWFWTILNCNWFPIMAVIRSLNIFCFSKLVKYFIYPCRWVSIEFLRIVEVSKICTESLCAIICAIICTITTLLEGYINTVSSILLTCYWSPHTGSHSFNLLHDHLRLANWECVPAFNVMFSFVGSNGLASKDVLKVLQ